MNNLELADKLQAAASTHYGDLSGVQWDAGAALRNLHTENMALRCTEMALRDIKQAPQQEPLTDEQIIDAISPLYAERRVALIALSTSRDEYKAIETAATAPLLQRIAELERQLELGKDVVRGDMKLLAERDMTIAELERQLEEARKDAERLDYIQKNARSDPKMDGNHVWWPTTFNQAQNLKGPTIRAAIDAAMQKGQS